jgi:hypothetical protein
MRRWGAWLRIALSCTPIACSFDSGGGDGTGDSKGSSEDAGDDGESDAASADDAAGTMTTVGTDTSSATDPSDTSDDGASTTDDGGSDTDTPAVVGCPDPMPEDWIFCNAFDGQDASESFSEWDPNMERMAIVDADGRDGSGALQFTHEPGPSGWAGRAAVRFGDSLARGTLYADDESFDEIWVRVFVRTESAWPDAGPGDLFGVAIETFEPPAVDAVDISLYTATGQQVIGVHPETCFTEDDPGCSGSPDSLGAIFGTTPVWGTTRADDWQCIELHVRLDEREADGLIELSVDGAGEAMRSDYTFVEDWSDHGWNQFRLTGSWDGNGPERPLHRWIDDVVISRAPIGCG